MTRTAHTSAHPDLLSVGQTRSPPSTQVQSPRKRLRGSNSMHPNRETTCSDSSSECDSSCETSAVGVSENRVPRQRKSATWSERVSIVQDAASVPNLLPPLPLRKSLGWDDMIAAITLYEADNNVHFRARDTRRTTTHNRTSPDHIPERFEWAYRVYRCTHGCHQKSRSTGRRQHSMRFVGCPARFTAVVEKKSGSWQIVIRNETRMHSHETNAEIASSYLSAASVDAHPTVLGALATLVDARANPKCITSFLADNLQRSVTSQQARNIISRMQGRTSTETQVQVMLDAFAAHEGYGVTLLQDQVGITVGIVMQTAQQKKCFELWGECLVMDWTHGSNNLGYHLGSLVVTTPTGRGIPVVDFLALNEKYAMIEEIFMFFKARNRSWTKVQTFVIDKDFVEWAVIEACFPEAKVLLCQYHAISYWRKMISRRSFNLKVAQREVLESMFAGMMKSYTASTFQERYADFVDYCRDEAPTLLEYFDKNWKSCADMWVHFGRDKYFSVGNTTTNRIEANWNQVKLLTGHRPRIDKCIAALLAHQLAVIRQFSAALSKHASHSRQVSAVPVFLRSVAARLSDYTYALVRKEFDIVHDAMKSARCAKTDEHKWEVSTNYGVYNCEEVKWSCSCLFFASIHLPCRHLMLVAYAGLNLQRLPVEAVDRRWCMRVAQQLSPTLKKCCATITAVLDIAKLKPGGLANTEVPSSDGTQAAIQLTPLMAASSDSDDGPSEPGNDARPKRRVTYVRLQRGEHASMVVLSSSEKYRYALSTVGNILDKMSRLDTPEFFAQLTELDSVISKFGARMVSSSTVDGNVAVPDSDVDEYDVFEEVDLLQDIQENAEACIPICFGGRDDVVSTHTRASNQRRLEHIAPSEPSNSAVTLATTSPSDSAVAVSVVRLPAKPPGKSTQKKMKQSRLTSTNGRVAIEVWPTTSITLFNLIRWSQWTQNLKLVRRAFDAYPVKMADKYLEGREPKCSRESTRLSDFDYNFVVPLSLVRTMERVLRIERSHDEKVQARIQQARSGDQRRENTASSSQDLVLSYPDGLPRCSSRAIFRLSHYYQLKTKLCAWEKDIQWLQRAWKSSAQVELFSLESSENCEAKGGRDKQCAAQVRAKYRKACFQTEYVLPTEARSIKFENVVGFVARDWWLNDSVILMCLQALCDARSGVKLMNMLVNMVAWPDTPRDDAQQVEDITKMKYVVLPVNTSNLHWMLIVAQIKYDSEIKVYFYDPLGGRDTLLEHEWEEGLLPFLTQWHDDYNLQIARWNTETRQPHEPIRCPLAFPRVEKKWLTKAKQSDASSCGALIIAQAHEILNQLSGFSSHSKVPADYTTLLRLRILWYIVHYCSEKPPPSERAASCFETHTEILQQFDLTA